MEIIFIVIGVFILLILLSGIKVYHDIDIIAVTPNPRLNKTLCDTLDAEVARDVKQHFPPMGRQNEHDARDLIICENTDAGSGYVGSGNGIKLRRYSFYPPQTTMLDLTILTQKEFEKARAK